MYLLQSLHRSRLHTVKYSTLYQSISLLQTVGLKTGYLRPEHLLFCSPGLYRVIKENHLKGFNFEIAHIVNQ
jgi:hypothetical protein